MRNGSGGNYEGSLKYYLQFTAEPVPPANTVEIEPNRNLGEASRLTSGIEIQGSFFSSVDIDYYRLELTQSQEVTVQLSTTARRTSYPYGMTIGVSIYNADGEPIGGFTSEVASVVDTKVIAGPGTVYIGVRNGSGGNYEGSLKYFLKVNASDVVTADIDISLSELYYGAETIGNTSSQNITISNTGDGDLQVFLSTGDAQFRAEPSSTVVPPGKTQTISVSFSPSKEGLQSANLTISSNDPDESKLIVLVSGVGVKAPEPNISVSVSSLEFGAVGIGRSGSLDLVVSNTGSGELVVDRIATTVGEFKPSNGTLRIAAGRTQVLTVTFAPARESEYSGELSIRSNDPDTPVITVALRGTGIVVRLPVASISGISPSPVVWSSDGEILFSGAGRDDDQEGVSIERVVWRSDLDGELYSTDRAGDLNFSMAIKELSIGAHTITLRVWDNEGDSAQAQASLTVQGLRPVAGIDSVTVNELSVRSVIVREGLDDLVFYGSDSDPDEFGEAVVDRIWSFRSESDDYEIERRLGGAKRLEVSAELLGRGRHYVYYQVTDDEGEESPKDSVLVTVRGKFGRAILVAGGDLELLQRYSAGAANTVYQTLISRRRFEREDVVYLNPLNGWKKWWKDVEVADTEVTADRLRQEIETAGRDNVERGVPLLIFLAGHGGVRTFQLGEREILRAEDLKKWLDELTDLKVQFRKLSGPDEIPADEVVVVVDFCYSRTFLELVSGPGRVVIGSSSEEVALVIEGTSFAQAFFRWLSRGGEEANLWRSFEEARIQVASVFRQAPYMDVDGDGIPLLDEVGNLVPGQERGVELARQMFIGGEIGGRAITLGVDPEIYSVSLTDLGSFQYVFEGKGDPGLTGLELSYAVLQEDGRLPEPGDPGTGVLERVANAKEDTAVYRGTYRFDEEGVYTVLILGRDELGNFAGQRQIRVEVGQKIMGDFNGDREVGFQDFVLFAQGYGKTRGNSGWDERFDLDGDGEVGFQDFIIFAGVYGRAPVAAKAGFGLSGR